MSRSRPTFATVYPRLSPRLGSRLATTVIPAAFIACGALFAACGSDEAAATVSCGTGTVQVEGQCLPLGSETGGEDSTPMDGAVGDGTTDTPVLDLAPKFGGALSASPSSDTTLVVTWAAATDLQTPAELIKYKVYVGTTKGGQNFKNAQLTTPPGAAGALLTGLTAGTEYFVVVRAVNLFDKEDTNVVEVSAKPAADTTIPTFSGAKAAEPADGAGVKLSWDAASDDLTNAKGIQYLVYWGTKTGGQTFSAPQAVTPAGVTSYVVKGLKPTTPYFFVVRARDAAGNFEENKAEVTASSGADTLPPVFGGCISAAAKTASSVIVSWPTAMDDVSTADAIKYAVYGGADATTIDYSTPLGLFTGVNSGEVTGLTNGTKYYFVCRAADESANQEQNKSAVVATTFADSTPPTFAGITTVENITADSATVKWDAGTDDKTPAADLVYEVFTTTTLGVYDFTAPAAAVSEKGATQVVVKGLSAGTKIYMVARARDLAGNLDTNAVEKLAFTQVSFAANVQTTFTAICAACHAQDLNPPYGLVLEDGISYAKIVNVPSQHPTAAGQLRVKPGDSANSWLYRLVTGSPFPMPPASHPKQPTALQVELLKAWIDQGAKNN